MLIISVILTGSVVVSLVRGVTSVVFKDNAVEFAFPSVAFTLASVAFTGGLFGFGLNIPNNFWKKSEISAFAVDTEASSSTSTSPRSCILTSLFLKS